MSWLDECDAEAKALTREKRQEFLDLIRRGMTIGAASQEAGVTFNAANGIIRMNIQEVNFTSLRKESL